MNKFSAKFFLWFAAFLILAVSAGAQTFQKTLPVSEKASVQIINRYGRIEVVAEPAETSDKKFSMTAVSSKSVAESEFKIINAGGKIQLEVVPNDLKKRIDLSISLPERSILKLETDEGEIRVSGDFATIEAQTETGTIAVDVPLDDVRYNFLWTASRPRFLSDVELDKVKEKSAGRFVVNGRIGEEREKKGKGEKENGEKVETPENTEDKPESVENETVTENNLDEEKNSKKDKKPKNPKSKTQNSKLISLDFTTARGIVLLNVNPNEVPSDLREKPLTEAVKAIIRSGDSLLMEAIRRASPKYFGEYAATLPPVKLEPRFTLKTERIENPNSDLKKVIARVTDLNNRAVGDLNKEEFQIFEAGTEREILAVEPTTAPFNLVLLLDVSGSVENYVDFIRKAARAFVETASPNDRIAIIIFNEDVKQLTTFTTEKGKLSESLDTFDAGGGTSYYDALAYTLAETLRPLRGERTAIVVLTDGDDNHSFLPFDSLLGALQESGALVYPLYVPSALIAVSNADLNANIDPLRAKYMGLTTKAEGEGERLAQISGGVYYPITQLSQIQKAYDDIVRQLRTAYSITFKSGMRETTDKQTASPRLKVKVKRENAFVKLGSVVEVNNTPSNKLETNRE